MTDFSLRVYDSILDMLSSAENPTPLVRLNRITPFKHTKVYAKLEWYNPFGAVKDRVAANLVRDAEERGMKIDNLVEMRYGLRVGRSEARVFPLPRREKLRGPDEGIGTCDGCTGTPRNG